MWSNIEDFIVLVGRHGGKHFAFAPIGNINDQDSLRKVIHTLDQYFISINQPFLMMVVPQVAVRPIKEASPWEVLVKEDRNNFDYIYNTEDLIELKGRKYHSKKNHINRFISNNNFIYQPIDTDILNECLEFEKEWCRQRNCSENEELMAEQQAIQEALLNYQKLKLKGGVIKIDGRVEAFTFGEGINDCTAVVHIEKANPNINGLYAVINQQFCLHELSGYKYVNREEDMGIEGLRKSKQSYHPVRLDKKYSIEKE